MRSEASRREAQACGVVQRSCHCDKARIVKLASALTVAAGPWQTLMARFASKTSSTTMKLPSTRVVSEVGVTVETWGLAVLYVVAHCRYPMTVVMPDSAW